MSGETDNVSVVFGAQIGGLVAGANQVKEHIESVGGAANGIVSAFTGVGEAIAAAFAVEKIVSFVEHMTEAGVELQRMEEQLGKGANEINIMSFAAENSEQQISMLIRAFTQFSRVAEEAQKSTGKQAEAFSVLGINAQQYLASGHSVNDLLNLTIEKLSGYEDSMNKAAVVSVLFGGRSAQLIHVLNDLGKNHDELAAAVQRSGVTLAGFDTTAVATQQRITELDGAAKGFWERLYTGMNPAVNSAIEAMTFWLEAINKVIDRIGTLQQKVGELFYAMRSPLSLQDYIKGSGEPDDFGTPGGGSGEGGSGDAAGPLKKMGLIPDLEAQKKALDEALANQKATLNEALAAEKGNYDAQMVAANRYFNWVKSKYGEQSKEAKEAATKILQIENQEIAKEEQRWTQFFDKFNSGLMGMLQHTTSWKQFMSSAAVGLVSTWLKAGEKMLAHWLATEHAKTAATVAGNAERTASNKAAAVASGGFSTTNALKTITGDAAKAYSGTYGFLAPEMGPLAAIPAALSFAAVMGMEALVPSFAVGTGFVQHDMLAQLHQGESVLTAHETERGAGGNGGVTLVIQGGINDAKSIRDMLKREGHTLMKSIGTQAQRSHTHIPGIKN